MYAMFDERGIFAVRKVLLVLIACTSATFSVYALSLLNSCNKLLFIVAKSQITHCSAQQLKKWREFKQGMVSGVLKCHSGCRFCVGMHFIFYHDEIWLYENMEIYWKVYICRF